MAKKVLLPVFPSDTFYQAVIRAADIVADEGGVVTFAFTRLRPNPMEIGLTDADGRPDLLEAGTQAGDFDETRLEHWRQQQISGLDEARRLCYERGLSDAHLDYIFIDEADTEGTAQAIADEAAAGAYDLVVLARGYFENDVRDPSYDSSVQDVCRAVQELEGPVIVVS